MKMNTSLLCTPIRVADYKSTLKEITQLSSFQPNNYRIKIPVGWVFVIRNLTRRLTALAKGHPELENFVIFRIGQLNTGDLFTEVSHPKNRSVIGLIRKAEIQCSRTCQLCSAPGRVYQVDDNQRSWCADCAAPHLLLMDIETFDERLNEDLGNPKFSIRRMPASLRTGFRKWLESSGPQNPIIGGEVGTWYAREWRMALRPMEVHLKEILRSGALKGSAP
jgi:hypothetical protein